MADEQLPDWLVSLRGQQPPAEESPAQPPAQPPAALEQSPDWLNDLRQQQVGTQPASSPEPAQGPAVRPDLLGDLRQQIEVPEEEARPKKGASLLTSLKPQQRLVLAVLLFFEVAVCGCLLLVMTERVWIP